MPRHTTHRQCVESYDYSILMNTQDNLLEGCQRDGSPRRRSDLNGSHTQSKKGAQYRETGVYSLMGKVANLLILGGTRTKDHIVIENTIRTTSYLQSE